ncbi:MAG: radical SAM protein [Caldilineaceae bacterium]
MNKAAKPFRIGLISPYSNLSAIGLRAISASLQAAGYATRMIFLPDPDELYYKAKPPRPHYTADTLEQVCALCADLDLVGITVMSNYVGRARSLTRALQERLGLPVIWGGIHPTVKPEESLQWADFVCVGEGEAAIVELVRRLATGQSATAIPNIWTRNVQGQITPTSSRPIDQDLDAIPLPDYNLTDHHILHEGRLIPLTAELMAHYLLHNFARQNRLAYMLSATRGCPFRCAFCCDNALSKMFPKWSKLRRRSPENLVAEIKAFQAIVPHLEAVMLIDSTFLAVSQEWLTHFAEVYRQEIGLPFYIQTTAGSIKEEKLKLLVEAGLVDVGLGLQTGSARLRALYQRFETNEQILEAGRILQRYQTAIPYQHDIISDNPYGHTEDQWNAAAALPTAAPHLLHFFTLTFYPGTDLYAKAKADGLVQDDRRDIYNRAISG